MTHSPEIVMGALRARLVRIKEGWHEEGLMGVELFRVQLDQWWSMVVWDGEEDPNCCKSAALEYVDRR